MSKISDVMIWGSAGDTRLELAPDELAWFDEHGEALPFRLPDYYAGLIDPDNPDDPVRRQAIPTVREHIVQPYEMEDPLGEQRYMPVELLIHRYQSRAVFLSSGTCAMYCRHCFRRNFTGTPLQPSIDRIERAAEYLGSHPEIRELLISGGDPLMLPLRILESMLSLFRSSRPDLVFRICTRVPVVRPLGVTDALVQLLSGFREAGIYVVTQYNHPVELSGESLRAVHTVIDAGIPVLNQTVLLKGVNDDENILADLMNALVRNRVVPYYLFHLDMARGTSQFRVSLERGLRIYAVLKKRLSMLALPEYCVDIPGGGGKVSLSGNGIAAQDGSAYVLENREGKRFSYEDPGEV
jgi:lysine 2,3-aminomutase